MAHILAHHPDMPPVQGHPPSMQEPTPPALPAPNRKRKAKVDGSSETAGPEPRRLRRSHEACARCRSKKIKCDSKHPRCTACTNAGTPCHQEDRHRQTLTPRGHTEKIERQLAQCEMLLKRRIDNFRLDNLDEIMVREGLDPDVALPSPSDFLPFSNTGPNGAPHPTGTYDSVKSESYAESFSGYGTNNLPPYPGTHGPPGPVYVPTGAPYPVYVPHMHATAFNQHIAPQLQQQQQPPAPQPVRSPGGSTNSVTENIKGQDPQSNDMSSTSALVRTFGVSPAIVQDLKLGPSAMDREDLAVGALHSGRDREVTMDSLPRTPNSWIRLTVRRGSTAAAPTSQSHDRPCLNINTVSVWLPCDREMVDRVVDIYFSRLDIHRPVFPRDSFKRDLASLYAGTHHHDPGFICSVYIILALGTLSEMNHRACSLDVHEGKHSPRLPKHLMPEDWPEHEEFFDRALAVKPDLRVTVSSLQALILLQWYLYTERQGRSLWRLVGSLVRLAVELGLHHDPMVQRNTFTPEECELRVRLWAITMVHDRGTSILLGRPLAIAPADSNTPHPKRSSPSDFSEHFLYSSPIADIQGDIVVSLYGPNKQTPDAIWKHATRIIKSITDCQMSLPSSYHRYFSGTGHWSDEERRQLVADITEAQGLTMLKMGIARILLFRALFSSKELSMERRSKALDDAMVILYGHMSSCQMLSRQQALEDVWMALDMLPRFRWRWDRKDLSGSHPLIAKLAEKVFDAPLHQAGPTSRPMLIPELDWSQSDGPTTPESPMAATPAAQSSTNGYPPPQQAAPYPRPLPNVKMHEGLAEIPPQWFYPLPHEQPPVEPQRQQQATAATAGASAFVNNVYAPLGTIGCTQSQESYMQEEKDAPIPANSQMELWMSMIDQQGIGQFMHPQG